MEQITNNEFIVAVSVGLACLGGILLTLYRLVNSKLSNWLKVFWISVIIIFNILGIIVFLVYYDYIFSEEKQSS